MVDEVRLKPLVCFFLFLLALLSIASSDVVALSTLDFQSDLSRKIRSFDRGILPDSDKSECDTDSDGINDSTAGDCWGGGPAPPPCTGGATVGCLDNCPSTYNPTQSDQDGDGEGDACDCDADGDGINDSADAACWGGGPAPPPCTGGATSGCLDNCPLDSNPGQEDGDSDGEGDACDCDADGDGINDSAAAACWGGGPAPPPCTGGATSGCLDNCPSDTNAGQSDRDSDASGDVCDNCPEDSNRAQSDLDEDQEGDRCDLDDGMIYLFFTVKAEVDWQDEAGFDTWNCYRGDLVVLKTTGVYTQAPGSNSLAKRDCGLEFSWLEDLDVPEPEQAAYYLATGTSGGLESGLGLDSAGEDRPNDNPCP